MAHSWRSGRRRSWSSATSVTAAAPRSRGSGRAARSRRRDRACVRVRRGGPAGELRDVRGHRRGRRGVAPRRAGPSCSAQCRTSRRGRRSDLRLVPRRRRTALSRGAWTIPRRHDAAGADPHAAHVPAARRAVAAGRRRARCRGSARLHRAGGGLVQQRSAGRPPRVDLRPCGWRFELQRDSPGVWYADASAVFGNTSAPARRAPRVLPRRLERPRRRLGYAGG